MYNEMRTGDGMELKKMAIPMGENQRGQKLSRRGERAQGMLEFALTLPILLMLLFGIMEFGRMMFTYVSVVTAAREAARWGAASGNSDAGVPFYRDCAGIRAAAIRIGMFAGIGDNEASLNIQYDNGPGVDNIAVGCPVAGTGPALTKGDRIVVTATTVFEPAQGLLPIPAVTVSSTARRTVLVDIPVR